MVNVDNYLMLDYDRLKMFLLNYSTDEERKVILSDSRIKRKLILPENRHELTWLCQEDIDGKIIPLLFDDEGIELLKEAEYLSNSVIGILGGNTEAIEEIMLNEKFCSLILSDIENTKYSFSTLSPKSAASIIKYAIEHDFDIVRFISCFDDDVTKELLTHMELSRDQTLKILPNLKTKSMSYLLETTIYRDILSNYDYYALSSIFSKDVVIPTDIIRNKTFLDNISSVYDPRVFRLLVNSMSNPADKEIIEIERKKYYEEQIYGYDEELQMTPNLKNVYQGLLEIANKDCSLDDLYTAVTDIIMSLNYCDRNSTLGYKYYETVIKLIKNKDLDDLKMFFQDQSTALLTDMIIDYSFEDVYDNVLKDIEQLVHFDGETDGILNEEKREIYRGVLRLDDLSYEEKIALFEKLKSKDFVEEFYDDYLKGRAKFEELLNSTVLNEESIQRYRHPISDELGVDVYVLEGQPFYALVKSFKGKPKEIVLEEDSIKHGETSSLSVITGGKLSTFSDPRSDYNIIYSGVPSGHVVHSYPVDSFTRRGRDRKRGDFGSERVNQLMTPEEHTKASPDYSEILVVQKPSRIEPGDELSENLEEIPVLGILCYDSITLQDVESARNLGCSIVCVMTKKYTPYRSDDQISMYDRMALMGECAMEHLYTDDISYSTSIDRNNRRK